MFKALTPELAPCIFETRVNKAADLYEKAACAATTSEEKASALKNLGACHTKNLQQTLPTQQASYYRLNGYEWA